MTNEEAIRILKTIRGRAIHGYTYADALTYAIEVLEQQKVGYKEWVQYDANPCIGNHHCSLCRAIIDERDKYCPNCGAKMEDENDR